MKIFILDNYDSFTYNLVHIIEQIADEVVVKRNDTVNISNLEDFDKIVLSPGPGLPSDTKTMFNIIEAFIGKKPILGVCLGHQAIAEYFDGKLINMPEVNHGREFKTKIINKDYIFKNVPKIFNSGRYHSWIVDKDSLPEELETTSLDTETKMIMSLRHKKYDIRGVQFHPESVMTKYGYTMIENWIKN
ncbi:MAG: aminodeoxychorismate/anthranilate synthase component II [Bacteroidales bacterium]|nr:aminodeoxychorismate/anthranilate synthase component II [Bacteroidales bacterium]